MAKKQYEVKTLEARVMDVAYIWDRHVLHTDESVILACLLHTKGQGRSSSDMKDVQRIMKDKNLELTK
jgi:hypothetical protein